MTLAVPNPPAWRPEELHDVDVPVGEPGPGEVAHTPPRRGPELHRRLPPHRPVSRSTCPPAIGMEAAGVIEAVGEGVTHLQVGDRAAYASQPARAATRGARVMPAMCVCKLPTPSASRPARP